MKAQIKQGDGFRRPEDIFTFRIGPYIIWLSWILRPWWFKRLRTDRNFLIVWSFTFGPLSIMKFKDITIKRGR